MRSALLRLAGRRGVPEAAVGPRRPLANGRAGGLMAPATATTASASAGGANDDARPAPAFASPDALEAWLRQRGISTAGQGWGSGSAKSVQDLLDEVAAGESALFETAGAATPAGGGAASAALRRVDLVSLTLACPSQSGPPMVLVEASQVLPDGRVRRRGLVPLSEKMRAGEGWAEAARRGVEEELGSAAASPGQPLVSLDEASYSFELGPVRDALSYPGLPTVYAVHRARGELSAAAFGAVLPGALSRRRQGDQGRRRQGQEGQDEQQEEELEFETVEEVPGKGVHRTTWRWVEAREAAVGGG